ncbi:MAG: dienelactone hydrolase family protein [bacterium]
MRPFALLACIMISLGAALAPAAPAGAAATTCLTAPFTLDDQRALAALRAATDTTCPCASFSSRGAYQRCARGVLDGAVGGAALRQDCVGTARKTIKGATCGSTKVACGRVRLDDGTADCRLSRAAACHDTRRVAKTACTAETHCADVVDWSAGTCFDGRDFGPYAPGFRTIQYSKDSVASPGTPRLLPTSIWYPAAAGSGPISATTGGVDNAPLATTGGPYPLVLFSHGSCGYPQQSKFLTPLLASYGFIVVAPPHPGNTINEYPACGSAAAQVASFVERPQDMIFVLNQILAANQDPLSPFYGTIDPSRIAMTGHSFGGLTTFLVAAIEPRIKAAVALAPATQANSTLAVPSLIMLGGIDSVISNPNARAAYERSVAPKLLVEIEHTGHYAFSDFCFPGSDCNPPLTLTSAEAHADALRFVLPFLKVYLAGDAAWAPLLQPPAQPGFVYAAQ